MPERRQQLACAAVAWLTVLCGGCASLPFSAPELAPLDGIAIPQVSEPVFLEVTPEMKSFLDRYVISQRRSERLTFNLVWAATDPIILGFRYDPALTLSPDEAFRQRTGNCLSFSAMFVAMARHLGLNARFQEVAVPPQWNSANNTLLVSLHINVVVTGLKDSWVVDISGTQQASSQRLRFISDDEVLAQYYNNLGADALTRNDLGPAYAWISKAIETEPSAPYLWTNLGVVYGRNGQIADAYSAHQTALRLDPSDAVASNNLFLLYQKIGDFAAAEKLRGRVERHRRRNPYYLYFLSAEAQEEGRLEDSAELLLEAIRLNDREYRFHYELARTQQLAGDPAAAEASLARALELAPESAGIAGARIDDLPKLPDWTSF